MLMMLEVVILPALQDNYIYVIRDHNKSVTAVVDPSDAQVVLSFLKSKSWSLDFIFNTHHHLDHVHGNIHLKKETGCQVVGSKSDAHRILGIDIQLQEKDEFKFGDHTFNIFDLSGHTLGHIGFYLESEKILFSGDVIFGLGCGRVFEGSHEQMFIALKKIKKLPPDTKIYCSHEYAEKNIEFAGKMDVANNVLKLRIKKILSLREQNLYTVPLLLHEELETNPFLRTEIHYLQELWSCKTDLDLFSYFRNARDNM
jgi:hydroxyacylglutathione hydrolase